MSKDPYLPPAERRQILREYGQEWSTAYFVETGTANGDTPAALMDDFNELWTIEVGEGQWKAACRRFAGTNVNCLLGDSGEHLPKVLAEIGEEPALFWLDGHYCGADRAEKDTPIMEELAAIFASGVEHVILIDDARLFEGMSHYGEHDWPHIDEVKAIAADNGYTFECRDDIVRLTPGV